jgi:proline iminopeptidase
VGGCGTASSSSPVDAGKTETAAADAGVDAGLVRADFSISAGDVTLHAWSVGGIDGGPVLVVLNGGPGFGDDCMVAFEAYASAGLRVAFFDQRGTGQSTAPIKSGFTLADYIDDLEAVRTKLGAERLHVLGHSWGGGYALAYAAAQPSRVASLTLLDNMPPTGASFLEGADRFTTRLSALQASGQVPNPVPRPQGDDCMPQVMAEWPVYVADPAFPPPPYLAHVTCSEKADEQTINGLIGYDWTSQLATVAVPVAVIFGASDPFGVDWQTKTAAAFPAATVIPSTVPQAGHFPWIEQPNAFDTALRAFLSTRLGLPLGAGLGS